MSAILIILLQIIVSSGILYGYYHFFLRNKQFHLYNRFYLLGSAVVSILIPFLRIPVYFSSEDAPSSRIFQTLQTISGGDIQEPLTPVALPVETAVSFNWNILLITIYAAIAAVLLLRILVSLKKIRTIIQQNPVEQLNDIRFVSTNEPGTPFSFFRWLFWDKKIELRSSKGEQIFRHELYHIQQKHSWDVIFLETLKMLVWINPFFHLIKKELRAIHEFLADQFAVTETEKWNYAELLLMQALETHQPIVNPFFHNQIKRRIAMITNPQKTSHRYLRKLLVLPVAVLVLTLFAFKYKHAVKDAANFAEPMTIVVDAGHGGSDPGAKSPDKKYGEVELSLSISQMIQKLGEEYNINVLMVRDDTNFPGVSADNADGDGGVEESRPDAFIAIHVNTTNEPGYQQKFSGFEAFISGKREDKGGQLLASEILQNLAPVYKTDMNIRKRSGSGIFVLDANNFPSVLLQCGYINNAKDMEFVSDKSNQEKIARKILEALRNYKNAGMAESVPDQTELSGTIKLAASRDTLPAGTIKALTIREVPVDSLYKSGLFTKKPLDSVLVVLNGVVKPGRLNAVMDTIPTSAISSINILKDLKAVEKYGEQGRLGVIEIVTRPVLTKLNIIEERTDAVPEIREVVASPAIKEVTVQGYPTKATGKQAGTVTEVKKLKGVEYEKQVGKQAGAPVDVKEVTVVGYGTKTAGKQAATPVDVKEVTVVGYATKTPGKSVIAPVDEKEVVVTGYATKSDAAPSKEVTVVGKPTVKDLNEVVVVGYGQELSETEDPIFGRVEIEPAFSGGTAAWNKYLERNLNSNIPIGNKAPAGNYTVRVRFIVDKEGNISNLVALSHHGYGMEEEVIRAIKNGPKWVPAVQNGKKVSAWRVQPVTFVVDRAKKIT